MNQGRGEDHNVETGGGGAARLHLWQFQAVRDAAVIAAAVLLILCGYWLRAVTVPLMVALALAYLFEPLVQRLTRNPKITRPMVAGSLVGAVAVLFAVVLLGLALSLVQTVDLLRTLPDRAGGLIRLIDERLPASVGDSFLQGLEGLVGREGAAVPPEDALREGPPPDETGLDRPEPPGSSVDTERLAAQIKSWLRANLGAIFQATVRTTGDALGLIARLIGSTVYIAFMLFLIPFYFFAFSTTWPALRSAVVEVFPVEHAPGAYAMLRKMDAAVSGFVRGRIVICSLMGVMFALGWWMCGVPYWLLVGLLTGLFSIVPYLGGIGLPIAIGLLWLGQTDAAPDARLAWWAVLLWPTAVFAIVQVVETYLLTPVIAGRATNLGPVSILVAVLAGGAVGGVYGMLLAIPAAACIRILITDLLLPRVRKWARGEARDMLPISGT